jgi:predicted nucleic acid-binding protein
MLPQSTKIVIDTCSIFNAINSNSLGIILSLPYKFFIGPIVYGECTKQPCPKLEAELKGNKIELLDPNLISVALFSSMSNKYKLGDGETECLCYGKTMNLYVCSDDRKARESITSELGSDYLIGTIGLLKISKEQSLITCPQAFTIYQEMKIKGAFLPELKPNFFC